MTEQAHPERLIELDRNTCRQLLAIRDIGRLALNAEPSPEVLPVNYALRGDLVVFRTGEGVKLAAATRRQHATFQVDGWDQQQQSAWSVMVRGRLEASGKDQFDDLPEPLAGGDRSHLVLLHIDELTGRRIPKDRSWPIPGRFWSGRDASDVMG